MRPLPFSVPGFDNDLNEKLDRVMQRAIADEAPSSTRSASAGDRSRRPRTSTSVFCQATGFMTST